MQSSENTPGNVPAKTSAPHQNYSLYVTHPTDLIGLVAYSLYKQHKIAYLESEESATEQPATAQSIQNFCHAYGQEHQVALLREKAESLLEEMNEELLGEAVRKLNADYEQKLKAELKAGMPLGKSVLHSIAGNITTAVLIALVVWGASTNFAELIAKLKQLFS